MLYRFLRALKHNKEKSRLLYLLNTVHAIRQYEGKTRTSVCIGIIIRSRARWHEHGERNSKYFLNLEKRNHLRKHIRKLRLSGVISTDPFEILEAERVFYENLYKSRRDGSEKNKPNFNFDDLPIPTLSNNSSYLGDGLISIEECKKSFKLLSVKQGTRK